MQTTIILINWQLIKTNWKRNYCSFKVAEGMEDKTSVITQVDCICLIRNVKIAKIYLCQTDKIQDIKINIIFLPPVSHN